MYPQAIVLDFDGTIVESADIKDWGWKKLFEEYQPEIVEEIKKYHRSDSHLTRYEKFRFIYEHILEKSYTLEVEQELDRQYNQLIFERVANCPFVPGAKELLDYFYTRVSLYIATVNPPNYFEKILKVRNLTKYFKKVYSAGWSKIAALKDIVACEECNPDKVIYIGDTLEDYEAARTAGIFFIGRRSNRPFEGIEAPVFDTLVDAQQFICKNRATSV